MSAEADLYRTAIRLSALTLGGIAVVGAAVGWLVAGADGAIAAVVGAAVAALGAIPTQYAMLVGHRRPPHELAAIAAFSWLGKMALILVALMVLQRIDSFHRPMFAATVLAGLVATLAIDLVTMRRARVPYVEPDRSHDPDPGT